MIFWYRFVTAIFIPYLIFENFAIDIYTIFVVLCFYFFCFIGLIQTFKFLNSYLNSCGVTLLHIIR